MNRMIEGLKVLENVWNVTRVSGVAKNYIFYGSRTALENGSLAPPKVQPRHCVSSTSTKSGRYMYNLHTHQKYTWIQVFLWKNFDKYFNYFLFLLKCAQRSNQVFFQVFNAKTLILFII